jgi:chromosome segregation ATPase
MLRQQKAEITELRAGHAERLVAIEEANVLLRDQQRQVVALDGLIAALRAESARHANRAAEQSQAAAERLAALTQAQQTLLTQGRQLDIYERAAADRLASLEATAAALEAETTRRSLLAEDLDSVRAALAEVRRFQDAEREGWHRRIGALEAVRFEEQGNSRSLAEQLIALRADLERVTAERDRYRRSVEELMLSEHELRKEILARQSKSLLN